MKRTTLLLTALLWAAHALGGGHELEERTAEVHGQDDPVATPVASTAPATAVNSRTAVYLSKDGQAISGWLAWPVGTAMGEAPGLIVIHEWWGLNDNIRATAERLAGEGYTALAVDLYAGSAAETPKDAMQLMQGLNADMESGLDNLVAAYEYLDVTLGVPKIGVVGWCLGGRWSLLGSLRMPSAIDATVIYYGGVTDNKDELQALEMPILGHFASTDPIVPPDTVRAFEAALDDLDKQSSIYIYPDTKHAFSNPSGLAYNKEAADLAWSRTVAFFATHLSE